MINGILVKGEGTLERVLDPASGKCIAEVHEASRAQLDAAVAAAEVAGLGWAQTVPKDRAARLQYGCTWINTHFMLISEMPHGGFKRSGYGKDLSAYGFEDYTRIKHVMSNIEA